MKCEIFYGVVDSYGPGDTNKKHGVKRSFVMMRSRSGQIVRINDIYLSAELDHAMQRSMSLQEPIEIWTMSKGAKKGSYGFAARMDDMPVYTRENITKDLRVLSLALFAQVAILTAISPALVFFPIFLFLVPIVVACGLFASVLMLVISFTMKPLSERIFGAGSEEALRLHPDLFRKNMSCPPLCVH